MRCSSLTRSASAPTRSPAAPGVPRGASRPSAARATGSRSTRCPDQHEGPDALHGVHRDLRRRRHVPLPADLWPRPGRVFAAARSHSFAQFATALDLAFGRWDLAHLHLFTLSDGARVSPLDWWDDEATDSTVDGHATELSRLQAGEQFAYVFDMGETGPTCAWWRKSAPILSTNSARHRPPGSLLEVGQPPGPIRTPLGRGRRRVADPEAPSPRAQRPASDPAVVGRAPPRMTSRCVHEIAASGELKWPRWEAEVGRERGNLTGR